MSHDSDRLLEVRIAGTGNESDGSKLGIYIHKYTAVTPQVLLLLFLQNNCQKMMLRSVFSKDMSVMIALPKLVWAYFPTYFLVLLHLLSLQISPYSILSII